MPVAESIAIPEFSRLAWVSDEAADVWKPRLERIRRAWRTIEWRSVHAGLRRCSLASVSAVDTPSFARDCIDLGLSVLPIGMSRGGQRGFRNRDVAPRLGDRFHYRMVVGRARDLAEFGAAWDARADDVIGKLLGYPRCCCDFFRENWSRRGLLDLTWDVALRSRHSKSQADCLVVEGTPEANPLGRVAGVRALAHLACRLDCAESIRLGREFLALGRELGLGEEVSWIEEVLSWPAEWSAKGGIAIIRLPVVKIISKSDPLASTRTVRITGSRYPEVGATGLSFPYVPHVSLDNKLTAADGPAATPCEPEKTPSDGRAVVNSSGNDGTPSRPRCPSERGRDHEEIYSARLPDGRRAVWDVCRLQRMAESLSVEPVRVTDIRELEQDMWFLDRPVTCTAIARHAERILGADLSHPILLSSDGRVMDGMHRAAKAWLEGREAIPAKRFSAKLRPDRIE